MKFIKMISILICMLTVFLSSCSVESTPFPSPSPDVYGFTLTGLDGNIYSLSDFKGEIVVVSFFTTKCKYCKKEIPMLQELEEEFKDFAVRFVLINYQEPFVTVNDFVNEYNITLLTLLDSEGKITDQYRVYGFPTILFFDREGNISEPRIVGNVGKETLRKRINKLLSQG